MMDIRFDVSFSLSICFRRCVRYPKLFHFYLFSLFFRFIFCVREPCSGHKKHENAHTNFELLSSILNNNALETKMNAIPHTLTRTQKIY